MPRGILAGLTDYSHQTFHDILDDLNDWVSSLKHTSNHIDQIVVELRENNYWAIVPDDMKNTVGYAQKFFDTSVNEIEQINQEIKIKVEQHHVSRLRSLAKTAGELNREFGLVWHREYGPKEYDNPNFRKVEHIYILGREMVVDMLDLDNVAERLKTFIGMQSEKGLQKAPINYKNIIFSVLLAVIIGIVSNVASSILPPFVQPYLWLSWPVLAILVILSICLNIKH